MSNKGVVVFMNYATNVKNIVEWFLHNMPMTHKKLQKLLYFSYGFYLAQNNNDVNNLENFLFVNNFEAWVHGPVDPTIYNIFKNNGVNLLYMENTTTFKFDEKIMNALNITMEKYGKMNADELEYESHIQLPWKNARNGIAETDISNSKLQDEDIYLTFKELLHE